MVESVEAKALDTDLAVVKVDQQKVTDLIIEMDARSGSATPWWRSSRARPWRTRRPTT